ncbi:MAG: hypothetical protein JNM78_17390 [Cyclobacteriaceae bacterium]|nr:hypothetical protein [Cyclobacteriaceae bacterium]
MVKVLPMNETVVINKWVISSHLISADSQKLIVSNMVLNKKQGISLDINAEKSLWRNLQEAFPDELKNPIRPSAVMTFMKCRKIAMANLNSPDTLLDAIAESDISEILFTGSFKEGSLFYRFYASLLGQPITRTIQQQRGVLLDATFFGHPVWLTVLYSGSGNANVGIARSQKFQAIRHQLDDDRPVHDYRIRSYREKFELPY